MAFINDLYSDYVLPMDYRDLYPPTASDNITTTWSFDEQSFPLANASEVKYGSDNIMFPERLGVSTTINIAEPTPELSINSGLCAISGFNQNFHPEGYESLGQCNHFSPDIIHPVYAGSDAWAVQCNSLLASAEEPSMKIRRYSEEERKDRIVRYLNKRNRRNFNKTIKYACRKTLADRRIRVRGRFARNNDVGQESKEAKNNKHCQDEEEYYDDDAELQMKHNGEEWLQEAVASLMYLPIFAG
ncbi:Cct motif family protein [Thalictrum thalictroides]|uniref:Cct motif family protein n=1 Tax=Thalictrum thalictroides TaxID=46969 RepID=A0A7J6VWY2_THATH|nr:Cct motif family protein [Thalictrum thalictroides]